MTDLKIPCFTAVKQGILRISECSAGGKSEHLIVWADDDTFIDD